MGMPRNNLLKHIFLRKIVALKKQTPTHGFLTLQKPLKSGIPMNLSLSLSLIGLGKF